METKVYKEANLIEVIKVLKEGGLVAFPTETVYGLGADALKKEASKKIYEAKGRPSDNPLIVHIAREEDLSRIAKNISLDAQKLMKAFWPGPLTLIFKKQDIVPYETTGGLDTVAVRMPNHKLALRLIEESGLFLAAPSANTSGRPSPTCAAHVLEDLSGKIDGVLDGGEVNLGLESTIVDVSSKEAVILRPGFITKEMLEKVIGNVQLDPTLLEGAKENMKPKAPGMKYKHYAPKGNLTIVMGETSQVVNKINTLLLSSPKDKVAVIATEETKDLYQCNQVRVIGTRKDEATIAAHLYRILRELDELGVEIIYSEGFSESGLGFAIMNRLVKAAGHQIIYA